MSMNLKCIMCSSVIPEERQWDLFTCCDFCEVSYEHHWFWGRTKINQVNGCIVWTGFFETYGYGVFSLHGNRIRAHRHAYELFFGEIPEGLVIDHLCRNRSCVNPMHLEAVTGKENTLRGEGPSAINSAKTHCKRGHPLFGPNLSDRQKHGRSCKECNRDRMRARRQPQ